jgi:predicted MFS family arabinose efflux permease
VSTRRIVWVVCTAQFLAQVGAFAVPALLPTFIQSWDLSNSEAGWITGIFYAGYTVTVPVLVALTDRLPAKWIYLIAVAMTVAAHLGYALLAEGFWSALLFRALAGIGWAGSYMPGLKALSDITEGPGQSRAVAAHAASIGVSGGLSFAMAAMIAAWLGWRWALGGAAFSAAVAFVLMAIALPTRRVPAAAKRGALLDFRPVFRNRSAMAYALSYCVHTWEMSALRQWAVTFLSFAAAGEASARGLFAPAAVAAAMGLIGVVTSVAGNETAIRFGRRRFILTVMFAGMGAALLIGFSAGLSYWIAAAMVCLYAMLIWADSSSLTAGAVGTARPGERGATMAVHSTLGYAGGFMGPLAIGLILDAAGGESVLGWGLAFAHLALVTAVGPIAMLVLRPSGLAGDRMEPRPLPSTRDTD